MINSPKTIAPREVLDANATPNLDAPGQTSIKEEKPAAQIQADGIVQQQSPPIPQPIAAEQSAGLNPPNGARPQHQAPNVQNTTPTSASVPENVLYGIEQLATGGNAGEQ